MKSAATGVASGCLVWAISSPVVGDKIVGFGVLWMCLCPLAMAVGGVTSTLTADLVADVLGPYLCPENSTAEIITFATTSRDENGNEHPATGYAMQCVDTKGAVVRQPSPDYAFYWLGILGVGSVVLAALLAVLFAAPIGALITYLVNRFRKPSPT